MSAATWRLTIDTTGTRIVPGGSPARWIVEGSGPAPIVEALTPLEPSPSQPDLPLPGEDDRPFDWPPQSWRPYREEQRYAGLGHGFYAAERRFENPQPASHLEAGVIQSGHAGSWDLTGYALWAPRDAAPAAIRRALRTGRP